MSVPKNKRNLSQMEFFHNATKLRREMTLLMLRDFGLKKRLKEIKIVTTGLSKEETDVLDGLQQRHEYLSILHGFPDWLLSDMRLNMLDLLKKLVMNITAANTIYPQSEEDYYQRRAFQNEAIGNCEQLLQEMQYIMSILPLDVNKLIPYVDMIEREIALLKGWRKSDKRLLKMVRKNVDKFEGADDSDNKDSDKEKPKSLDESKSEEVSDPSSS